MGLALAGGEPFRGPWGRVASANITPNDTGIKNYSQDFFVQVLRTGAVNGQSLSPDVPIMAYGNLNDTDLKAVYSLFAFSSYNAAPHR